MLGAPRDQPADVQALRGVARQPQAQLGVAQLRTVGRLFDDGCLLGPIHADRASGRLADVGIGPQRMRHRVGEVCARVDLFLRRLDAGLVLGPLDVDDDADGPGQRGQLDVLRLDVHLRREALLELLEELCLQLAIPVDPGVVHVADLQGCFQMLLLRGLRGSRSRGRRCDLGRRRRSRGRVLHVRRRGASEQGDGRAHRPRHEQDEEKQHRSKASRAACQLDDPLLLAFLPGNERHALVGWGRRHQHHRLWLILAGRAHCLRDLFWGDEGREALLLCQRQNAS
mmetsp:Transcript_58704/g.179041  ORF Transcript_58704/g.179041 Transcript_58704/m.179041 type:complete len:284 (-) Transcript_58704:50-901(-)